MWKLVGDSVEGTSHGRSGTPCQDSWHATPTRPRDESILVAACADGAGSSELSHIGADIACRHMVGRLCDALQAGCHPADFHKQLFVSLYGEVHDALCSHAEHLGTVPRELACTLLCAIIGESAAVFGQIGDGSIVFLTGDRYVPVFWPQAGEYVNTTSFITDSKFADSLEFMSIPGRIDEIGLLTDGLQRLALNFVDRTAHQPFFAPMFAALRASAAGDELAAPLRGFLKSAPVNERTDDDKTLVLATRVGIHDLRQSAA